jgi:hypothetical protein
VTRALLEQTYPGMHVHEFEPTHWVRVFVGSSKTPVREDYVRLEVPDVRGVRFGYVPGNDAAVYAVISSGMWQCLDQHGFVRDEPVRYLPDYVAPSASDGFVYFAQSGPAGPIKIGWSQDVARRLEQLQTANAQRLVLLGTVPGRLEDEAALHTRFAHLRMEGEWFQDALEIHFYLRERR